MLHRPSPRRRAAAGRRPGRLRVVVAAAALLCLVTSCSDTGLAGRVTTTTEANSSSTTVPLTTAPLDSGTSGGSSGGGSSGGSGGTSGGGSDQPQGFLVYQDASTPTALWTVDADGSNKKQLPAVPGQTLINPQISPNGQQLAFLATPVTAPGAPAPTGSPKLWVAGVDGKDPHPLTTDAVADTCFAWAQDGNSLLSATTDPVTGKGAARSIPKDPSVPPKALSLDLPGGACPVYIDANTVAYITAVPPLLGAPPPRPDRVATVRLDGQPSTATFTVAGCTISDLRGAAGGGVVSFAAACDQPAQSGIYLAAIGGQSTAAPQPSLVLPAATGPLAISFDGHWVAYTRISDPADPATAEVLLAKTDGTGTRRLVAPTTSAPTWGPPAGGGSDSTL